MRKNKGKHTYVFKRNASLKKEVFKQLKATNIGIYNEVRRDKSPWWAPSPYNLLIFSIGAIIIGLITHIHELGILPICVTSYINLNLVTKLNDYMIEICIGIGAVLIGFAFFVAQSFLDKEDPERGRVLLYTSGFYLLLSSSIAILLMYIFGKPNIIADLLIVTLGIFTVWSLYRTVKVLLYVNEMEKARLKLFKDIIKRFILHEICRRISYQELFKANETLQKKYKGISLSPFDKVKNGVRIKAIYSGTVIDIKLGRFERLFLKAEKSENTRGQNEQTILNLHLIPYYYINEKNNTLIEIQKDIFSNFLLKKNSDKEIRSIITIKKADYEENTEIEISKLKQRCFLLIEQERSDEFEKALSTFTEVTNLFIDIFYKVGWNFKKEQAERQRGAFSPERFKLLDWIIDSYTLIFYKAVNSDNLSIIRYGSYLPISFSLSAIKRNDHLIFQNFIRFPVLMYIEGCKRKQSNKEAFDFLIERSWRYLKELSDFSLRRPYEEGQIEEQDFIDYSFYIFKVFQDMIKQSFNKRDTESFKIYLSKHKSLYEHHNYYTRYRGVGKSIYDRIKEFRNQTLYGIGSWIFNRYLENKEDINKTFLNEVFRVWELDIIELTELFIDVHGDSNRWGWDDWEIETKEEGKVYSLNIPKELERFYIAVCLKLLQSKPSVDGIHLPFSSELASLIETLIQIIHSIKEDPEKWDLLTENQILKSGDLIRLLERAKEQQKEKEAEIIRKASISMDKVNAFKEGVLKSMRTMKGIKSLMQHNRAVILENERSNLHDNFGINSFFDKEWFIDVKELNTAWVGIDEHIGESMIIGENQKILQKLQEVAQEIPNVSFEEHLDIIENLDKVTIIAVNYQPFDFFENKNDSFRYIANWYADFSDKWIKEFAEGLEGVLIYRQNRIPVYEYFNNLSFKGILIVNFKNLKLSQYPLDLEGDEPFITIDVQGFESGSIEEDEIIKIAPEWLKKIGDEEAQRHYLEGRVIVKVFEQFDLIIEKDAVAKIPLE